MSRGRAGAWCALAIVAGVGCVIPLSNGVDGGAGGSGSGSSSGGLVLPPGTWVNATGNLAADNQMSECGNMSALSAKADEDMLIAGISLQGLWASTNGGTSWQRLGTGAGSAKIINRMTTVVYDPANAKRFWEVGIYNGGGIYQTVDDGVTFTEVGMIGHLDLVSIDFSDPDRKTMVAGGHEQAMTLSRSTDAGATWDPIGGMLPANTNCTYPLVVDAQTYLVGCAGFGGGPRGIWRSTDSGATWSQVSTSGGATAPLRASDGSIYWASGWPGPASAIYVNEGGNITRSTDNGQTWVDAGGLGIITDRHPIELPDGRLVTLGQISLMISADQGKTWNPVSSMFPYNDVAGVVYSAQEKAFFVWHSTCGNGAIPVPPDAVQRFDFDYTMK